MGDFYLYAIKSIARGIIYIGISQDPEERLKQHNHGYAKFTKSYRPWELIYLEYIGDRQLARKKEKMLKQSYSKKKFLYSL